MDTANSTDLGCGDASESESGSPCSTPRTPEARDGTAKPSPARSDIAGQAAWRDRADANPHEPRKTSRRLWQKSQVLGYTPNCFTHTLVLPLRRECFERQGEVFLCMTDTDRYRPSAQTIRYLPLPQPIPFAESAQPRYALDPKSATWKKEPIFFFPSSRAIYLSRGGAIQVSDNGLNVQGTTHSAPRSRTRSACLVTWLISTPRTSTRMICSVCQTSSLLSAAPHSSI